MKTSVVEKVDKEQALGYLRSMYEIRNFEERVYELVRSGTIKGASHLYIGQEAVAVGAIAAITEYDLITSTHRGHGHCGAIGNLWAKSEEERQEHWNKMLAELMGRSTGYCKGRGGSMHIADVERGNVGATGIVGGNIPIAVGAAMSERFKKSGAVVLCFFGDGAVANGAFHEAVNFAAIHRLPVVFICENNLYGMSMPYHDRSVPEAGFASPVPTVAERASAYGMPGVFVNGMDVFEMKRVVEEAVDAARRGDGPTLVEARTYRFMGHSMSDQQRYRTKEEVEQWREHDPILLLRGTLMDHGLATEQELDAVAQTGKETIDRAAEFAINSPFPSVEELTEYVYVVEEAGRQAELMMTERALLSKVRPIEDEIRQMARDAAGKSMKGVMPKLNREQAQELEQRYGIPIKFYYEALNAATREEMERDPRVFVMGEDIGLYGGAYAVTRGLFEIFGHERIIDTPISELAIAGIGAGAAMRGMRPIVEFQYADFLTLGSDQIIHNAAYNRFMFGGKTKVPLVYRSQGGVGRCIAAHHSESMEAFMMHWPGLYVVMPSTPFDAKGLLKSAVRNENPVVFLEHKLLYSGVMGPVPDEDYVLPIGVADIKKTGKDLTLVAYNRQLHHALDAAFLLEEREGIQAEVIDPRTLKPLDVQTIAESVRKTGRLVIVSEGFPICGVAGEVMRQVIDYEFENGYTGWDYLDAKPLLLSGLDCPIPMSEPLEDAVVPNRESILDALREWMG